MNKPLIYRLDWTIIFCYLILVFFGLINIYSSNYSSEILNSTNSSSLVGKQIIFTLLSICLGFIVLGVRAKFYQQLSYIVYILSIFSLLGLFVFGQTINGANSWYIFGGIGIQPSEFSKIATSLMIARHLSEYQTNLKNKKSFLIGILIIALPATLIILQPDPGSSVVFCFIFLVFFREGLSFNYLILLILSIILFILTLLIPVQIMIYSIVLISFFLFFYFRKKKNSLNNFPILSIGLLSIIFIFSVNFIFNSVFEQRHRDRFNVILGITQDSRGIGYNIEQSKIAIGSGGLSGKGFLQGTQTKGNFVPEQQTDYIFTTVGEEWGFIGGFGLIAIFVILIVRMLNQAEKQTNIFKRTIIYCIASIFFGHFTINIGMTLGLLPTIGIPLPFMSAGGSSLLTFSLFIFIYLNFDSNRLSDW